MIKQANPKKLLRLKAGSNPARSITRLEPLRYGPAQAILGLKCHREIPDGQRKISKGEVTVKRSCCLYFGIAYISQETARNIFRALLLFNRFIRKAALYSQ